MCTSISFSRPALYGRNLDLEVSFGERVVITPRDYPFPFHNRPAPEHHFAMVGMASVAAGVPLYAEAMNEKGLYLAGLNFPGNAVYFPDGGTPGCVAPYELIPLVLGTVSYTHLSAPARGRARRRASTSTRGRRARRCPRA